MSRLTYLTSKKGHPHYGKLFKRLAGDEVAEILDFIGKHEHFNKAEFEFAVNRMHLDQPNKPKNWTIIQELLLVANHGEKK